METYCLLDANSIIKYYHDEKGSNVIKHLLDEAPSANINLLNLHFIEVISAFYSLKKHNRITGDEAEILIDTFMKDVGPKMRLYDFKTVHLKETLGIIKESFQTPPPDTTRRKKIEWIPFRNKYAPVLKEFADMGDLALIRIMKEIQHTIGESYLFTSDGHIIEIAKKLHLSYIDPEKTKISGLPEAFNRRISGRDLLKARAVCYSHDKSRHFGSLRTKNIHPGGACIECSHNIDLGDRIFMRISSLSDKTKLLETMANVQWKKGGTSGVQFLEPINVEHLN